MMDAFVIVIQCFRQASDWFVAILDRLGAFEIWFTAVAIVIGFKTILAPLFGQAHSDSIEQSYTAFKNKFRYRGNKGKYRSYGNFEMKGKYLE